MSDDKPDPSDLYSLQNEEHAAILYRLDERTERIDSRIERMDGRVQEQDKRLDEHDNRIQRNQTIINGITFGLGSFLATVIAKVGGFIRLY